jgi:hypothetical protein
VSYEKRIGERIHVGDVRVRWSHLNANRAQRPQKKGRGKRRPGEHVDAYLRNVSASGAGIVARADEAVAPGSAVQVSVDAEASFVAKVRRVIPTSDPGYCLYGVEITEQTEGFLGWLRELLDQRREGVITESHWRSAL